MSFPRRPGARRNLTADKVAAVERVQNQLATRPPAGDVWIDPGALTMTRPT
jgi:hypothetical protein